MSLHDAERVADALLFEGYMLYPYRPSSVKNRQRFNFGVICPPGCAATAGEDAHRMRTECLVSGGEQTLLDVKVRFLQLVQRTGGTQPPWQEAIEQSIVAPSFTTGELCSAPRSVRATFAGGEMGGANHDDAAAGAERAVRRRETIEAVLTLWAKPCGPELFQLSAEVQNASDAGGAGGWDRDEQMLRSLVSTHTILSATNGSFISVLDPPDEYREAAAACNGVRSWPVLAGSAGDETGRSDTMLSSPIIIYDHPALAPESAGDLFDGTEIDEILSLRILTMTDAEKAEMRGVDERARRLLERTEALGADDFAALHGIVRDLHPLASEHA
jgi:hydrogenase maturation protease